VSKAATINFGISLFSIPSLKILIRGIILALLLILLSGFLYWFFWVRKPIEEPFIPPPEEVEKKPIEEIEEKVEKPVEEVEEAEELPEK